MVSAEAPDDFTGTEFSSEALCFFKESATALTQFLESGELSHTKTQSRYVITAFY